MAVVGDGGCVVGLDDGVSVSLCMLKFRNMVFLPGQVYTKQGGMALSVFSNMESVALFVNDVKDPNVTNHPHREIPLPPWMCLLLQGNISSTVVGVFFWFH